MGQREDVMASLVRGDSRDGLARRRVADKVKAVTVDGASRVANTALVESVHSTNPEAIRRALGELGTAASAVVLASDLRAPAETRAEFVGRLTGDVRAGRAKFAALGEARQGWRNRLANVERLLTEALERTASTRVDEALTEVRAMLDDPGGTA